MRNFSGGERCDDALAIQDRLLRDQCVGDGLKRRAGCREGLRRRVGTIGERGFQFAGADKRGDHFIAGCGRAKLAQRSHQGRHKFAAGYAPASIAKNVQGGFELR